MMSARNTLKNLGTVIECAENVDDSSNLMKRRKAKFLEQKFSESTPTLNKCEVNQNENIDKVQKAHYSRDIAEDDQSPYQSAFSSMNDFGSAENGKAGCHSKNKSSESEDESEIVALPSSYSVLVVQKAPQLQNAVETAAAHHSRTRNFVGGPFSNSRLSLITFLNNIATPSNSSIRRTHQQKRFETVLTTTNTSTATMSMPTTMVAGMKVDTTLADKHSVEESKRCVGQNLKFFSTHRQHVSLKPIESLTDSSTKSLDLALKTTLGSAKTSLNTDLGETTMDLRQRLIFAQQANANDAEPILSSSAVRSGKSFDKISNTSDLTLASAISASSISNSSTNASGSAVLKQKSRECVVCCTRQSARHFTHLINCGHRSCCKNCLVKYLNVEIMESRTGISCPQCAGSLHVNDIHMLLARHPQLLERYVNFSLRRVLSKDPDTRWCPAPDCTYAVIASACAACPQLSCARPGCGTMFCYHCKNYWHPNQTCDQARESELVASSMPFAKMFDAAASISNAARRNGANISAKTSKDSENDRDEVKSCPRCGALIVKMNDGSCNHMTCALCGVEFCWLCLKQINELHYISPTGCTFWGKKPWTRKKKLLWQIGTLIGAPLGIALIAGLAVPGIICGVPIFVGRRTYQQFCYLSRTKRHLITAVSITGSLLVSPILAVMAVGVGVPIMLAYVYGVVPLSLCRNGGCGANANTSDSVDAELADDLALLTSESQERFKLIRVLREDEQDAINPSTSQNANVRRSRQKQSLEITVSDRSSASSPSGAFCAGLGGSFRLNPDASQNATIKSLASSSRGADGSAHDRVAAGAADSGSYCNRYSRSHYRQNADDGSYGGGLGAGVDGNGNASNGGVSGVGCSVSRVISAVSQRQAQQRGVYWRQHSNESGVMSLGENLNTEDASVKAIAGSQYNYDDRSVHTIWSSGGGVHHAHTGLDGTSYKDNEDNASTRACGGSVLEARSLAESGTSSTLPHLALLSRERDVSPQHQQQLSAQQLVVTNGSGGEAVLVHKKSRHLGDEIMNEESNYARSGCQSVISASPSPPFFTKWKSYHKKPSNSTSCDELNQYQQQRYQHQPEGLHQRNQQEEQHLPTTQRHHRNSKSHSCGGADFFVSSFSGVKKSSVGTQRSLRSGCGAVTTCSSAASVASNFSAPITTSTAAANSVKASSKAVLASVTQNSLERNLAPEQQETSRISLRRLFRRPINLLTGRSLNNNNGSNFANSTTVNKNNKISSKSDKSTSNDRKNSSVKITAVSELSASSSQPFQVSKSVKICSKKK